MEQIIAAIEGFAGPYADYVIAFLIIVASLVIAKIVCGMLTFIERRVVTRSKSTVDDVILESFKGPVKVGIFLFGLFLALKYIPALTVYANEIQILYTVLIPVYVAYVASRIIGAGIEWYTLEISHKTKTEIDDQFLPIIKKVIYGVIFGVMIVVMLSQLGVRVETVIAAMGIGGLALALALQPTLSNFFSGAQMVLDRPLRIGDFVELESGDKGTVVDIGWRSTKIRTYTNNIVVMPNSKIADSKIINYNTPNPEVGFIVNCGVAYNSDLEKVEKISLEVAKDVLNKCNGVKGFKPLFRFNEFGDSSINFRVIMRTKALGDSYLAKHEFIKALKKRFDRDGIEIPFPQTDVHLDRLEKAKPKKKKK